MAIKLLNEGYAMVENRREKRLQPLVSSYKKAQEQARRERVNSQLITQYRWQFFLFLTFIFAAICRKIGIVALFDRTHYFHVLRCAVFA